MSALPTGHEHLAALHRALDDVDVVRLTAWGGRLAAVLAAGGRLLAAGNGGSAAEAQHLTAELVGRFRDDRPPMSAIALHADTSALTAIGNDYGYDAVFARQVRAHGRPGDVLILLSTSGRSTNLLHAARAAHELGMATWGLVGAADSPLAAACDEVVAVGSASPGTNRPARGGIAPGRRGRGGAGGATTSTATVQETHLVAVHLLCAACDAALGVAPAGASTTGDEPAAPADDTGAGSDRSVRVRATRASGRARSGPLVIVGDALLDRDVAGRVERLAPDAPVPVLDEIADTARPGGAGLAALLAAGDGADVVLVTALAGDDAGRRLAALLADAGIAVVDLGLTGPTPQKIRLRAGATTLLRLDRGSGGSGSGGSGTPVRGGLPEEGRRALAAARGILVSDYGRGLTHERSVTVALASRPGGVPLVWDPHPRGGEPCRGATLVTPNLAEARGFTAGTPARRDPIAEATDRGRRLVTRWGAGAAAITLGERGAVLVGPEAGPPLVAPAEPVDADPCGAGDRFAASAAALLGAGALPSEAVVAATRAAGAFLAAGGVSALPPEPGRHTGEHATDQPGGGHGGTRGHGGTGEHGGTGAGHGGTGTGTGIGMAAALEVVRRTRARGGVVVSTGGCFDLLHAGHVNVLAAARRLGDCLVVCLNSDLSVRRLKGPDRPLVSQADRAAVLLALGSVDAVVVFDDDTPAPILARLRPDVFAKGGDYAAGDLPEAAVVESWRGQAVILPYLAGRSTTSMIREAVRRGGT
ncbi:MULTISPECIES: PfkB family carbohydrate kinase [Frankia]|uniref:Phosphoheptose isomerase with phosphosugar-binding domain (Partial match) n=1 Tax=Frankia alni (strain DSM 45986 / CECT 9034 / ACN14a) TaxID=326424 RepID=Q0RIT7_FRAAA|nr:MULTISPECIES: PfkB family carbohydrate kinase [Frankia]CAJ62578.1 putative phosphoheptose isomerase with phosphosugar-binding domain (partial match) [Frankia alni ACN14a]